MTELGGCRPAPSSDHAARVPAALTGREGVGFVVPDIGRRCVRIHHPLADGRPWADAAPELLAPGTGRVDWMHSPLDVHDGNLGHEASARLAALLAEHAGGAGACHYGIWTGWGWSNGTVLYSLGGARRRTPWGRTRARIVRRRANREWTERRRPLTDFIGACPVMPWWGGRDMFLFDGPVAAAGLPRIGLFGETPQSPQWWWPEDRSWFVANEIDDPVTYVTGPDALVDAVLVDDLLEIVEVRFTDAW